MRLKMILISLLSVCLLVAPLSRTVQAQTNGTPSILPRPDFHFAGRFHLQAAVRVHGKDREGHRGIEVAPIGTSPGTNEGNAP
jgi:hypothetical protein